MNNNYSWWGLPTPLKNDGVRQLGLCHSQYMESHKNPCSSHHQSDKIELIIFIDGFPKNRCRKSSNILLNNTFFCAIYCSLSLPYCYHIYIYTIVTNRNWSFFSVWSSNIRILYMIANANFWSSNSLIYHRYWYHISG